MTLTSDGVISCGLKPRCTLTIPSKVNFLITTNWKNLELVLLLAQNKHTTILLMIYYCL